MTSAIYRSAAKRLLQCSSVYCNARTRLTVPTLAMLKTSTNFCTTATTEPSSNQSPNNPFAASSGSTEYEKTRRSSRGAEARAHYQDEQARVLNASLRHVPNLGWTEAAMVAGAREVGISPSIVGSFPRKEAALVERLIDIIDSGEDLSNLILSERIAKLVRIRLEMQGPYISKWAQALSIQAQPANVPNSFKQRAMLVDEIWHAAGDDSSDIDWYVKRTVLGGIYSTTEIYMLTDSSTDFRDTWAFLNGRIRDAFDLKKSIQEAKYLAEAIGAGMGTSVQGFMETVFKK